MLYTKDGFPEVNDVVYCSVKNISGGNTVFVDIEEFEKEGIITISEIAPGRIRNLRDHVEEGRKIVCKVIRVDPNRNRIDVSLRRVSVIMRNQKLEIIKKEEFAEKMYADAAKEISITKDELFEKTYAPIFEDYETVFESLYAIMIDNTKINMFTDLDEKQRELFLKFINDRIKPEEVTIKKVFKLTSHAKEGADIVRDSIDRAFKPFNYDKFLITYKAAGEYGVTIVHEDKKSADKMYSDFMSNLEKEAKENSLVFSQ
jgi:translation initiation factor 2 subunit 1